MKQVNVWSITFFKGSLNERDEVCRHGAGNKAFCF